MTSNRELSRLLLDIKGRMIDVKDRREILSIVTMAKNYNGEIKYNNKFLYSLFLVFFLSWLVFLYLTRNWESYPAEYYLCGVIGFAMAVSPLVIARSRNADIDAISSQLFVLDMMLDGIQSTDVSQSAKESLLSTFTEFKRGNDSREFSKFFVIESRNKPKVNYFNFHYVDKRTETYTSTDGKGNVTTQTRTVYDHYDRYGLLFELPYGQGLSINSSGVTKNPVDFITSYGEFNRAFTIGANNDHDAAKYLKPALLTGIMGLRNRFSDLNIQISNEGQLLIAFSDALLNQTSNTHTLADPEAFYTELQGHTHIAVLEAAYELHDLLTKYLDSNFN